MHVIVTAKNFFFVTPQGSLLMSHLFNIFVCCLFSIMSNIGINTPYITGTEVKEVIKITAELFNWFLISATW